MVDNPLPVDDDEEEQEKGKRSGRSAFMAGLHRGEDNYTGSFRGVPTPKRGGTVLVKPEETLGDEEHCWCGLPLGHAWPGKDGGARHPRTEEGMAATVKVVENPRLEMRALRSFDERVARMMMDLVNTYGVRFRIQKDGQHVLLYPLNEYNRSRPFKVSAHRPGVQGMEHLEKWVKEAVTPALVVSQAEILAEKFNDPSKVRRARAEARKEAEPEPVKAAPVRAVKSAAAPEPTPEPVAAPASEWAPPDPAAGTPPEGYEQAYTSRDKGGEPRAINWWKEIDKGHWLCKSCDYEVEGTLQTHAAHQRAHSQPRAKLTEAGRKAAITRNRKTKREKITAALQVIAEASDVEFVDERSDRKDGRITRLEAQAEKLGAQVQRLTAQRDKAVAERDEYKAKLDIIREGLRL